MTKLTWQRLRSLLVKEGVIPKGASQRGWRVGKRRSKITLWFFAPPKDKGGDVPTSDEVKGLQGALNKLGVKFVSHVGIGRMHEILSTEISLD
jgi:hypothetical protein